MDSMELLLSCQNIEKHFGAKTLFTSLSFSVTSQDRIGLLGPNGSGKSTLLKILFGLEDPTSGTISKKNGLVLAYVPQEEKYENQSIFSILMDSLHDQFLEEYEKEDKVNAIIEECKFKQPNQLATSLSGGYQKRLGLARALLQNPDLILFDEPTNHLDLDTLFWLEDTLNKTKSAYIIVSHDRSFLENTCDKIIEINKKYPKGCFIVDGPYHVYLQRKESFLSNNAQLEQHLNSKLKKEIEWLKRSPKARTTKSESRIKDAHELKAQHAEVKKQNTNQKFDLTIEGSKRETQKLISIKNLTKSFGSRILFKGLDLTISPSTRLGILGFNGSGKTTLLKIITKEITQDAGTIKYADDLKIVYFKQNREIFEKVDTLRDVLSPNSDYVEFMGKPIHINGFCKSIGFDPSDLDMPCFKFSGGEKARALIGKLMLEKADVLLLDEPTNDLDIDTLDTLLEMLKNFQGAIIVISHDRFFLDALCNEMVAIGLDETPKHFTSFEAFEASLAAKKQEKTPQSQAEKVKKPSNYQDQKRLAQVLQKITTLEKEIENLSTELERLSDPVKIEIQCKKIAKTQEMINTLILEWESLEEKLL